MGTSAYNIFRKLFPLPNIHILTDLLQRLPIEAGLSRFTKDFMRASASSMSESGRVCVVMWDKMAIHPLLQEKGGEIIGHEDWGTNCTNKIADHVLVFFLQGLETKWTIPLSFNFCQGATHSDQLRQIIKDHVRAIYEADFTLVASVCDQGSANESAIKTMLQDTMQEPSKFIYSTSNITSKNKKFI